METEILLGLRKIKAISDYQFGRKITEILLDETDHIKLVRSPNTNRIRYIYYKNNLLLTLRPTNGLFTLTFESANKIISKTNPPKLRIVVLNEISEYIKKGRNVFCKHIVDIDDGLRPLDEVIVVNQNDDILGIGKLKIPVSYAKSFSRGIAVNIRKGINKSKILKLK